MDILLVDQGDILGRSIVTLQDLDIILLDLAGLLHDMLIRIGQGILEKTVPFRVRESIVIQGFQALPEVDD